MREAVEDFLSQARSRGEAVSRLLASRPMTHEGVAEFHRHLEAMKWMRSTKEQRSLALKQHELWRQADLYVRCAGLLTETEGKGSETLGERAYRRLFGSFFSSTSRPKEAETPPGTITCRCQKCIAAAEARTGPSIGSEWPLPPLEDSSFLSNKRLFSCLGGAGWLPHDFCAACGPQGEERGAVEGLHLAAADPLGAGALGGRRPGRHAELRWRVDARPAVAAGEAGRAGAGDGDPGEGQAQEALLPGPGRTPRGGQDEVARNVMGMKRRFYYDFYMVYIIFYCIILCYVM